jgi:hypothetical protein
MGQDEHDPSVTRGDNDEHLPPPVGRSTTKWTVTYESSTDAGYLAVQSGGSERLAETLPGLLQTLLQGLAATRGSPGPGPQGPVILGDDDNVVEFPGARPWYSPAFARRLARLTTDPEKFKAMLGEFVVRFDRTFERGQAKKDIVPMLISFFEAYEGPDTHYLQTVLATLSTLPANERLANVRSWLEAEGASDALIDAALRAASTYEKSDRPGDSPPERDDDDDGPDPA